MIAIISGSWQDAEKVRQLRSRIVQSLNVPPRIRLSPSLAAALLDGLFEHPARVFSCCGTRPDYRNTILLSAFFRSLLEAKGKPLVPLIPIAPRLLPTA